MNCEIVQNLLKTNTKQNNCPTVCAVMLCKNNNNKKNPPRNTKEAKPCSGNIRPASILVIY